ncbi:hypothetical protein BKA82DRAFT_4349217 [Pisolithus tinctorius]|nr:hypothetical protein BKA82DRAFT_4349217 [Pisolithus tinctorius]
MAPGCFSALWCIHQPPSPSDDAVVPQVPAPVGAAQPPAITDIHITALTEVPVEVSDSPSTNVGGLCTAAAVENTHPCSPVPSPGDNGIPIRAPSQGSPSNSTGALAPALIEAQPTGLPSSQESADTPFLAHTEEVLTVSISACPTFRLDPAKAKEQIDRIDRFRILIMGRANAGKTTILQRVCNTTDQPEIFNGKGEKVDAAVVQGSLMVMCFMNILQLMLNG